MHGFKARHPSYPASFIQILHFFIHTLAWRVRKLIFAYSSPKEINTHLQDLNLNTSHNCPRLTRTSRRTTWSNPERAQNLLSASRRKMCIRKDSLSLSLSFTLIKVSSLHSLTDPPPPLQKRNTWWNLFKQYLSGQPINTARQHANELTTNEAAEQAFRALMRLYTPPPPLLLVSFVHTRASKEWQKGWVESSFD